MIYSPVASWVRSGLEANPDLTPKQVDKCIPLIITRIVGFLHNAVQVRAQSRMHMPDTTALLPPHTCSMRAPSAAA